MPMSDREPVFVSKKKPTGLSISYPVCGDWQCDDFDYDWDVIGPEDVDYPAVKREQKIAHHHEPQREWWQRLYAERDRLSGGDPLWWGKPKTVEPESTDGSER